AAHPAHRLELRASLLVEVEPVELLQVLAEVGRKLRRAQVLEQQVPEPRRADAAVAAVPLRPAFLAARPLPPGGRLLGVGSRFRFAHGAILQENALFPDGGGPAKPPLALPEERAEWLLLRPDLVHARGVEQHAVLHGEGDLLRLA